MGSKILKVEKLPEIGRNASFVASGALGTCVNTSSHSQHGQAHVGWVQLEDPRIWPNNDKVSGGVTPCHFENDKV